MLNADLEIYFSDFAETAILDGKEILVLKDESNITTNNVFQQSQVFLCKESDFISANANINSEFIYKNRAYIVSNFYTVNEVTTIHLDY